MHNLVSPSRTTILSRSWRTDKTPFSERSHLPRTRILPQIQRQWQTLHHTHSSKHVRIAFRFCHQICAPGLPLPRAAACSPHLRSSLPLRVTYPPRQSKHAYHSQTRSPRSLEWLSHIIPRSRASAGRFLPLSPGLSHPTPVLDCPHLMRVSSKLRLFLPWTRTRTGQGSPGLTPSLFQCPTWRGGSCGKGSR